MSARVFHIALADLAAAVVGLCLMAAAAAGASAPATGHGWWHLDSTSAPSKLPAHGTGQLLVTATNAGNGNIETSEGPVTLTDELPPGVTPVEVTGELGLAHALADGEISELACSHTGSLATCTSTHGLPPYQLMFMRVKVATDAPSPTAVNVVNVQGGQAVSPQSFKKPLVIDGQEAAQAPFGVEAFGLFPEAEGGVPDMQAGSHPYQLTTALDLNQTLETHDPPGCPPSEPQICTVPSAPALVRDLHFKLPPGLLGDPSAVPRCSDTQFTALAVEKTNLCPADTAIGVATVTFNEPSTLGLVEVSVPVFNLEPAIGEPARFGFEVQSVPVILKTALPSGGEYGVQVSVENASQAAQVLASQVTLWGVPADPSHDSSRGWECLANGAWDREAEPSKPCEVPPHGKPAIALLTLPTSCAQPPVTSVSGDSWAAGQNVREQQITTGDPNTVYAFPSVLTGCDALEFGPSLTVQPEAQQASTPTGLDATVTMPQAGLLAAQGTAEPALKDTTVTLPEGLQLNPSAANGLQACAALQFGFDFPGAEETEQTQNLRFAPTAPACPDAAKVGTATARTPLLPDELTGSLYLGAQNTSPFQAPLVLYLVAEDRQAGVLFKLAGSVTPNPATGQLMTTFENTPQAALFTQLKLHFLGGQRAALSTPANCGSYSAATSFTAWSGQTRTPSSEPAFQIDSGPAGGSCPSSPLPFAPAFSAGSVSQQGGAYSPFVVHIGRPDGEQALSGILLHLPPGESAMLSHASPCPEPSVGGEWACGPGSLLGHAKETVGLGSEPVTLSGDVYLTSGYDGAPFGLLVRTHVATGPFDLGWVNVRSRIDVDPHTAAATITTEPGPRGETIPTMLDGIPVQLKALEVVADRPEFAFNPTNCGAMSVTGVLDGSQGAADPISYPFGVANCAGLPFHPTFRAATKGRASKANGASLVVKVTSSFGQANIGKAMVILPSALPSRLTTIQKACVDHVFDVNPALCPGGSVVGSATVRTPVLESVLTGPAYLVSHGGAAFPDLEFVLQGEGITLILDGHTAIRKGVTSSTFSSVPDAPVTSFEAVLPKGPHSALTTNLPPKANYSLCKTKLTMPTTLTGQNGALIERKTKIAVEGCPHEPTPAQMLQKALKACRKRYKHAKSKRHTCERKARKEYTHSKKKNPAQEAQHPFKGATSIRRTQA